MAAVYLATQVNLNRRVALKVLTPPPDADDPATFVERFQLEAETLASLDHPNIVTLHDFGEMDDGRFFLAMEYVEGPRLSDTLRAGPLEAERALHLLIQVCAGLHYAHKRGVIHRDLKPSNLLIRIGVDGEEQVKVVDFGLVKLAEADQSITRAGLILGSPHCMAPEQVKGLDVDHCADIYATGVLLFRIITGKYPFHGSNSAATMIAHLNQPVPTFFSVAPEMVVPEGLEEIVRRCLQKSPAERYQSMGDLMDDLADCMAVPPPPSSARWAPCISAGARGCSSSRPPGSCCSSPCSASPRWPRGGWRSAGLCPPRSPPPRSSTSPSSRRPLLSSPLRWSPSRRPSPLPSLPHPQPSLPGPAPSPATPLAQSPSPSQRRSQSPLRALTSPWRRPRPPRGTWLCPTTCSGSDVMTREMS